MNGPANILTAYFLVLATLLGLTAGSFCNNWAFRLCRNGQPTGRSKCPDCGHMLEPQDLIPLLSFLRLRGKCRYCGGRISWRYPVSELVALVYFLALVLRFDPFTEGLHLLRWGVMGPLLLTLALQDWESWELSDGLMLGGAVFYVVLLPWSGGLTALWTGVLGGLCVSLPLLLLGLAADKLLGRETIGGGDIKLFAMLGLHLEPARTLLTLILACFLGILAGLIPRPAGERQPDDSAETAVSRGKLHPVPFGPAICAAACLSGFWGGDLINWYTGLFQ